MSSEVFEITLTQDVVVKTHIETKTIDIPKYTQHGIVKKPEHFVLAFDGEDHVSNAHKDDKKHLLIRKSLFFIPLVTSAVLLNPSALHFRFMEMLL